VGSRRLEHDIRDGFFDPVRKSDLLDTRKLQKNEREILGGRCVRGLDMKGFANVKGLEGTNTN
jgi:hypothetical protein